MAKDIIKDLMRTARNKSNPYWKRKQALAQAKYDIEKLSEEIAKIEWGMK